MLWIVLPVSDFLCSLMLAHFLLMLEEITRNICTFVVLAVAAATFRGFVVVVAVHGRFICVKIPKRKNLRA